MGLLLLSGFSDITYISVLLEPDRFSNDEKRRRRSLLTVRKVRGHRKNPRRMEAVVRRGTTSKSWLN